MALIGKKSGVVVHVHPKTGKKKYASAHDFRRAFGDGWAIELMPAALMELVRHESIATTMRFYVGSSVQATADVIWDVLSERRKSRKRNVRRHVTLYVTLAMLRKMAQTDRRTQHDRFQRDAAKI